MNNLIITCAENSVFHLAAARATHNKTSRSRGKAHLQVLFAKNRAFTLDTLMTGIAVWAGADLSSFRVSDAALILLMVARMALGETSPVFMKGRNWDELLKAMDWDATQKIFYINRETYEEFCKKKDIPKKITDWFLNQRILEKQKDRYTLNAHFKKGDIINILERKN